VADHHYGLVLPTTSKLLDELPNTGDHLLVALASRKRLHNPPWGLGGELLDRHAVPVSVVALPQPGVPVDRYPSIPEGQLRRLDCSPKIGREDRCDGLRQSSPPHLPGQLSTSL
jgi:hypothetical protein